MFVSSLIHTKKISPTLNSMIEQFEPYFLNDPALELSAGAIRDSDLEVGRRLEHNFEVLDREFPR